MSKNRQALSRFATIPIAALVLLFTLAPRLHAEGRTYTISSGAPNAAVFNIEDSVDPFDGKPLAVSGATAVGTFRHTVTNRRITFELFRAHARRAAGYEWIDPAALATVPHPSYVRKALELAALY